MNRPEAKFCGACGTSLAVERACAGCGAPNPPTNRFCEECGAPLEERRAVPRVPDHLAEKMRQAGASASVTGERKQVTVMFADLMGSMDLAEEVDPERWRGIMDRFFGILCDGVHRFEGTVDKFTGDGIMALFGAPIAHEDHAARACYAALHLHDALAGYAAELRRTHGLSFSVRIGLNSGEVVVGGIGADLALEYTAIGHTVGLAQRMESLAEPGTTYLTAATASLAAGYLELADLGDFTVKGTRDPVRVHRLEGVGNARTRLDLAAQRGFSSFVGRGQELAALEAALERSHGGQAQVVGVVGEAGVGKSRLCHEFAELAAARGLPVYRAAATAHGRTLPFGTALELLRTYFGIDRHLDDQAVRERVAGRLLLLDPAFGDDLPLLFEFLGVPDPQQPAPRMDPEARQRRLLAVVARLVHAQSERDPGVTILEDLHWVDSGSELLLEALIEAMPGTRALVVANFRPEYRADWMTRPHYVPLPVVPLGAGATEALLRELLGEHPSLNGLPDEIRRRTGGNPFFIEEVVRTLAEEGVLEGDRGSFTLARSLTSVTVPPTVQAVLAARIDRLSSRDKRLLQSAAVLGREFGEPVLERVAELSPPDLAAALRALTSSDFLFQQALYPEPRYAFRHPLTHEVAYGSQLGEHRARVHAAVARAIEELYADSLDERAALLAHHWEAADEPLHAARWSARAGMWAGTNAPAEALRWWRRVHDITDALPEDAETRALGIQSRVWMLQFGWRLGIPGEEAAEVYRSGCELADAAGDVASRAILGISYAASLGISGRMSEGRPIQHAAVEQIRALDIPALHVGLSCYRMYTDFVHGDLHDSLELGRELLEAAGDDPTTGAGLALVSPVGWIHMMRANTLYWLGHIDEGDAEVRRATELVIEHGDGETEGWISLGGVLRGFAKGDEHRVLESAARALELAERNGSAFSRAWALSYAALANVVIERYEVVLEFAREALRLAREQQVALEGEPFHLGMLARGLLGTGDLDGALAAARESAAIATDRGTWGSGAGSEEVLAETLVASGRLDEAEEVLSRAMARAAAGAWRPSIVRMHLIAADIASARGERDAARGHVERAHALALESGLDGWAARSAERLAAPAV